MECTRCGAAGDGRFCGACGASLISMDCSGCGRAESPGRRYCTGCGTRLGSPEREASTPAGKGGGDAGWWVAGVLLVVLVVAGGVQLLSPSGDDASRTPGMPGVAGTPGDPDALGPAPDVDLSSMSAREAADRLFDRVMRALSAQDTTEIVSFLPMALDAYELAEPLDHDGRFHVSVLERTSGDPEAALATAEGALAEAPDHLLNLAAAAQAARDLGLDERARDHYAHLLEVWDTERARDDRPEYEHHAPLLPEVRREAEAVLDDPAAGGGP